MDDLISRQAAIAYAISGLTREFEGEKWIRVSEVRESLQTMPSAERRGRWVDGKRMGFDGTFHWFRQCSECLYEREDDTPEKDTPYCPNCGASMMDEVEA